MEIRVNITSNKSSLSSVPWYEVMKRHYLCGIFLQETYNSGSTMKKKHLNKPKLREMYKIPILLKLFKLNIKKKKMNN